MPHAANRDGAAVYRAEQRNRIQDYPDVEYSPLACLLSLGCETYGKWSSHSLVLVRQLAVHKSRNAPEYLRKSIQNASYNRWWNLLVCTVQKIVIHSILRASGSDLLETAAEIKPPLVTDLLDFNR